MLLAVADIGEMRPDTGQGRWCCVSMTLRVSQAGRKHRYTWQVSPAIARRHCDPTTILRRVRTVRLSVS